MHDRQDERAALEGMLQRIRVGQSSVLVLRGEAGIGKTALMEFLAEQASECTVSYTHLRAHETTCDRVLRLNR